MCIRDRFQTSRGRVCVSWRYEAAQLSVTVQLPPGTSAQLFLPDVENPDEYVSAPVSYTHLEHNDAVVAAIQGLTTGQYDGKSAAQYVQDAYDATVSQNDYLYDWWDTWTEDEWAAVAPSYIPVISVD